MNAELRSYLDSLGDSLGETLMFAESASDIIYDKNGRPVPPIPEELRGCRILAYVS